MSPDPTRFSRLLFYISSGFIAMYLAAAMWRLNQRYQDPVSIGPDDISPVVDLVVIATVILAYAFFLLVRYLRGREERAFRRYYEEKHKREQG